MNYFLGVDVGSSKTHALIVDELGGCHGFGQSGPGNYQGVGYDGLEKALNESVKMALTMAGLEKSAITSAGFGIAGYDFPSDRPPHMQAVSKLGLGCPIELVNDGLIGLLAGSTRGIGVNVTAGSSNNCRGRNRAGKEGRIVGNGAMFGEYGGAIEIVMRGLQMVNYAWIKRIPPTSLTTIYLDAVGARNEIDLMEGLSNNHYHLFPYLAVQIFKAAQARDQAACQVMRWAGEELGWLAVAVTRQIEMENEAVEIIQSGSVFDAGDLVIEPMKGVVLNHCPSARILRLEGLPVIGAVILGMEQIHFDGYAIREKILDSSKKFS